MAEKLVWAVFLKPYSVGSCNLVGTLVRDVGMQFYGVSFI